MTPGARDDRTPSRASAFQGRNACRGGRVRCAWDSLRRMLDHPPFTTLSHYRLLELLGRGAMGEVWLAEDTQLPRRVAIKLLPSALARDGEAVERLLREARAAASVDHPNVVTVYEAGVADGHPFLVMQRVEGETLEQRLARGRLSVAEAVSLAASIA